MTRTGIVRSYLTYRHAEEEQEGTNRRLVKVVQSTNEQIALQVNTKVAYVTRTKSILKKKKKKKKKEGRLIDTPQTAHVLVPRLTPSPVDYFAEQMHAMMMKRSVKTDANYPNSLTEKQVELLYTLLNGNTDPVAIIGTTGFSPTHVEIEYERFQRLKGREMGEFQRKLLPFMESRDSEIPD